MTKSPFDHWGRLLGSNSRRQSARKRRLLFESLETRKVLANFEVTSLLDTTDANDGVVTLREAIASANASAATPDTITFTEGLSGTIELTQGPLQITDSVVITGNGAANTIIDAKQASRVLNIEGTSIDVGLSGLTITGGRTTGDNQVGETIHSGGGIRFLSSGSLTITDSTVSANSTTGIGALGGGIFSSSGNVILQRSNLLGNSTSGYSAGGGGILTNSGNVTLTRSTLSNNRTTGEVAFGGGISTQTGSVTLISSSVSNNRTTRGSGSGGGIYSFSGSVVLTSSTVSGNSTAGDSSIGGGIFAVSASVTLTDSSITNNSTGGNSSGGGGIFAATGNVTLNNSTVSGNRTAGTTSRGGGIYARAGNVTLTGSTLSGNQVTGATSDGGGIWFDNSIVTILNSTITANTASGAGGGLGMVANPTDKKLTIHNTIVAGNTAASDADFTAPTTPATNLEVKSSLIGNNAGTTLAAASTADANGNLIGTTTALLDPKLGPLSLNGGTTQTHALLADSPAINAGDDALVTGQNNDQRGAPFGRKNDVVDIGAYELRTLDPSFFVVTTLNDELDYSNTAVSLREAINSANGSVGTDTITFNLGLSGTIALSASLGQLPIANSLIINGNGANNTVVDAGKQGFRVIEVTGNASDVTLSGMTLTGGQTTGTGGGINFDSRNGTLILNHSTLSDNSADTGGGMFNTGLATLNHSTLSGNSARRGGGIDSYRGVTLNHSTLSGNSAVTLGGGILNRGTTTLNNSTLSGNRANLGGGVYNNSTITLNNSTLSGNTSNRAGGGMFNNGTATLSNSTLAGNSAGTSGGGLYNNSGQTATLNNSIVAGSLNGGDISGAVTGNANLIGNPNSAGGLVHGASGNILGTDNGAGGRRLIDVATVLAPLAFNGGPTMTHALVPNSPAINRGSDALVASTQINDQRGAPFVRKNGVVDIGAFELGTLDPNSFIVTTLTDELDYSNTDVSLREAINSANGNVGTDTITFSPSLFTSNAAISFLELGELPITESIVIDGPGQDLLAINASARSRVLNVIGGTAIDVSLEGITLSGGRTTGSNQIIGSTLETTHSGGGIRFDSTGTLTLTGSTVSGNSTAGTFARGGGIDTTSGTIALIGSTVAGNSTVAFGGGIHLRSGTLTLTDSTVSGNTTSGDGSYGGGIVNYAGPVTLTRSTVAGNRTAGDRAYGAGIFTRSGEVKLTNSTIADNRTEGSNSFGGGIRTFLGNVTLLGSTVSGNRTTGDRAFGGGIYTARGTVSLTGSTVSGNSTEGDSSRGGGAFIRQGVMTLTNSTVSGNTTAGQRAYGGGIYLDVGSTLNLTGSTVSGNSTSGEKAYGGGIYANFATATLTNSTVSGNRVTGTDSDGGGIGLDSSALTVVNSTITGNSATRAGGGISVNASDSDKKLTIHNSIIAGNTAASAPDFTAPPTPATNLELRFSLIGNNAGTSLTLPAANGNLIGTATAPLDPKLGPLATNGGITKTHALLADSPAINKGSDALVDSTQINDQRGAPFGRKNGVVDMGAYELRTLDPSFFVVTTLNDELDYSNTAVSLREAIISANGNIGTDTITFNPSLFTSGAASIVLTRGELPVTESIVIDGPGQDLLTIDANQLSRVMNILGGTAIDVNLEGMTLTGGRTSGNNQIIGSTLETTHSGGGIRFDSIGTLTLTGSAVSGNSTTGAFARGGGIDTTSGNVTLIGSTVSGNSTTGRESSGGGIHSRFGNVKLTDSTISGNSTAGTSSRGGGLYTRYGNAEITRSTISGNSTSGGNLSYGGGIHMDSGALVMNESTVSNNSTTGDGAFGGGIRTNDGTVTLSGTTVSDNFTTGGYASGGGIFTRRGAVTLADSVVSGNRTTGRDADGGGIYSIEGAVTMTNSTISGNSTTGDFAGGGGVYVRESALTLTRSTVSGNRTSGRNSYGGGIYSNYNGATLTLIGSTISGNQVTGTDSDGGGVGFNNSVVTILNSTITGNSAARAGGGLGMFVDRFDKKLTIRNSIIAGNTAASNPDFTAPTDPANNLEVRFSLIGNNAGTSLTLPATGGNLIGTATAPIDPKLGPLVSGGGPTQTHALLPGSPALDAADQTLLPTGVTSDQRGVTRVIDLLNISNPSGKTGLDIGAVEMVGISIASVTANESAATIDFVVTLSHAIPSGSSVSVDFSTANINGQAIAGTDYTTLNQRIVFVGGGALTATVAVPLLNDSLDESNETFSAALTNPTNAIITQADAVGTITDDDAPPTVTLSRNNASIAEAAGTSIITASLSAASSFPVTINLGFTGTATLTSDYTGTATQIVIPAGQTTGTVTVTAVQDSLDEPDETIIVDITGVTNGTEATPAQQVTVTITDDDAPPTVTLSSNNAAIAEADGTSIITATISTASSLPVTINLGFTGTATLTSDYTRTGTQIVIPAGQTTGTVTVTAVQDSLDEVNETIIVDVTSVTNGTEATPQQITVTITDDDEPLDFGDAPAVYPVTLAQNGARHATGNLFLGSSVDAETNGTPSTNADSDGADEDGVFVLTTFIASTVATTSSFSVIASRAGKLDAWIDFNKDGDWSDIGEQIFASTNVVAGENLLSFNIPAGSTIGNTGARFRLSTVGGLAPTGAAVDGEVEDYLATIVTGSATAALDIELLGGDTSVVVEGDNVVVRKGTTIISKVPFASFGELNLNGSPIDDLLQLTILQALATRTLEFDGGVGKDFLELVAAGETLDLTSARITLRDVEGVDVTGTGGNRLVISIDVVKNASSTTDTLEVVADADDTITFVNGFKVETPAFINGEFTHILTETVEGGTARVELRNGRPLTNPLTPFDADRNGRIQPLDALRIINELSRRGAGPITLPTNDGEISRLYVDVSGDAQLTALDALRVLNAIARITSGSGSSGEGEGAATIAVPYQPTSNQSSDSERRDPLMETIDADLAKWGSQNPSFNSLQVASLDELFFEFGNKQLVERNSVLQLLSDDLEEPSIP